MHTTVRRFAPVLAAAAVLAAAPAASARPLHSLFPGDCVSDSSIAAICGAGNQAPGLNGIGAVAAGPDDRTVYAVSATGDALTVFDRGPTGRLAAAQCFDAPGAPDVCPGAANDVPGLDGASDLAVTADGRSVYVASQTDDAIVRFDRAADGRLTPAGCIGDAGTTVCGATNVTEGLNLAVGVAVSADGTSVYATSVTDSALVRFDRAATGALTPQGCIDDLGGAAACGAETEGLGGARRVSVAADGLSVYTTGISATDAALVRFNRAASGAITAASECFNAAGAGGCTAVSGMSQPFDVAVSPDGLSAYVPSPSANTVFRFDRGAGGALTGAGCIDDAGGATPCGTGNEAEGLASPQRLTVPDNGQVLVTGLADRAVVRLDRSATGALTDGGCIDDVGGPAACGAESEGLATAVAIAVTPDGGAVFVSSGATDQALARINREIPPRCSGSAAAGAFGALQSVPLNCADSNDDPVAISVSAAPAGGTLGAIDQGARTVPYAPLAGFFGIDAFTVRATADGKVSNDALVRVTVGAAPGSGGGAGAGAGGGGGGAGGGATTVRLPAKLIAALAADRVTLRRGAALRVRFAATAAGSARLQVLQGRKVKGTVTKRLAAAGRATITLTGKIRGKPRLAAGRYTVRLTITGTDKQTATDTARLTVTK